MFGKIGGEGSGTTKIFRTGADRIVEPRDTIRRVEPFLAEMGISRIATLTGLDRIGIPVVAVCRPNSRSISVSQGKGVTLDAAVASGLMESIENHHAEHINGPLLFGSYDELNRWHPLVDISRLPRLTIAGDCQRDRRLWIEGRSLFDGEPRYLPYEVVSTDYRLPLPPGSGAFAMNSNGLASGNVLLEAISHGLCELVERDGSTLWHFSSLETKRLSRIDLTTVTDGDCRRLLEKFAAAEIDVLLFETTTDIGIPSFRCEIADREGTVFRSTPVVSGYGCHPRREVALSRAMTEAAQGRLTLISGSRDDINHRLYDEGRITAELAMFRNALNAPVAGVAFADGLTWTSASIEIDVAWELDRLQRSGFDQAFVVDLTIPRFRIPVCRVVVLDLESFHEAPGFVLGSRARRVLASGAS